MLRVLLSLFLAVSLLAGPLLGSAEACCPQAMPETAPNLKMAVNGCFEHEAMGKPQSAKQLDDSTHDRNAKVGGMCHHCCHASPAIMPVGEFAGRSRAAETSVTAWRPFHFRSRTLAPLLEPPAHA